MNLAEEAVSRILVHYGRHWAPRRGDPFKSLVRTILSQNTNYRNEDAAYTRLEEMVGVTPSAISEASVGRIAEAIRPAGMYNQRSLTLKKVADAVLREYGGDLIPVLKKPYEEAREELMRLPGVGQKTADVVLLFSAGRGVIPVDRHINRISKRLALVPEKACYDDVRRELEGATSQENYLNVHVGMIQFGRDTCRALNPRCDECFLADLCPHPKKVTEVQELPF
jgi:endonuclease-3